MVGVEWRSGGGMATIRRFEEIEAWQYARGLVNAVYKASADGRFARDFALLNQARRAAISVMSNIAEGFERGGNKEFVQFLATAKGSCGELRSQLYVAADQGYIRQEEFDVLAEEAMRVSRMVAGLIRHLRQSELKGAKYR